MIYANVLKFLSLSLLLSLTFSASVRREEQGRNLRQRSGATQGECYELGGNYAQQQVQHFCSPTLMVAMSGYYDSCLNKYNEDFVNGCKRNVISLAKGLYDDGECGHFKKYDSDQGNFVLKADLCENN